MGRMMILNGSPRASKSNSREFAQLLKLEDEQVAKDTPYIFFTTEAAVHVFEIFALIAFCLIPLAFLFKTNCTAKRNVTHQTHHV